MTKYKAALDGHTHKAKIEADQQMAGKFDARGTPAFFINGRFLSGAQPVDKFKEIIDDELKRVEKLKAKNVPAKAVYATLMAGAKDKAEAPAQQPAAAAPDDTTVYKVPVTAADPVKGPSDALVTVVIFSDYQCPFCSRVEPTLAAIAQKYGNDVRFVWKDNPLPFHQDATPAAIVARDEPQAELLTGGAAARHEARLRQLGDAHFVLEDAVGGVVLHDELFRVGAPELVGTGLEALRSDLRGNAVVTFVNLSCT